MRSSGAGGNDAYAAAVVDVMVDADIAGVVAIERACFRAPWSERSFRDELRNPRARNLVARTRGRDVLGYACAWVVAGELKINNVAVDPEARRRGIGRGLVERLIDDARDEGCSEATLEVRPSNRAARRLYLRLEFREVGVRRAYYQDDGEDAIVMVRRIGPASPRDPAGETTT